MMLDESFPSSPIFYGVAYSPSDSMEPRCGNTARDIVMDVARLSQVTNRIKNYGMQCRQSEYILQAIDELKLNMTLAMGIWIGPNEVVNESQMKEFKKVVAKYPEHYFQSIFVGNEVLFRQEQSLDSLIQYVDEIKKHLKEIGYENVPVGTTEIGSLISERLLEACDIVGANMHPFFRGGKVEDSSNWVYNFVKYQIPQKYHHKVQITEVGWPYQGGSYQSAISSAENFQKFLSSYVCEAYNQDFAWYYFEAFDEPWKKIFYERDHRWETEWGIFMKDRGFKNGTYLPQCYL